MALVAMPGKAVHLPSAMFVSLPSTQITNMTFISANPELVNSSALQVRYGVDLPTSDECVPLCVPLSDEGVSNAGRPDRILTCHEEGREGL